MIDKAIYLLQELKDSFAQEKMEEILNCLENEIVPYDLYSKQNEFRAALNGQHTDFYQALAIKFVSDLNELPDMYFLFWASFIEFLNEDAKLTFFEETKSFGSNSDATDYINGLIELESQRPEIALFHFNRIEDYVAAYFIAHCYYDLENFENSIRNNLIFLEKFEATIEFNKLENGDLKDTVEYKIVKYSVHNDLAYCYNRIGDFPNAHKQYEEVLKLFTLEDLYTFRKDFNEANDLFLLDINNILLAIEKTGYYSKGLEIIHFVLSKYPSNSFYQGLKEKFEKKVANTSFAEGLLSQVFNTKKPFNIERSEATKLIAKEKILEDMIVEQIKYGYKVFGKSLEIYQDQRIFGRQYYIPIVNGILDLLLIEKNTNIIYVVELKRNGTGLEVLEQIERYIDEIKKVLTNRDIRGIICLHKADKLLVELTKNNPKLEIFTYEFNFNKLT